MNLVKILYFVLFVTNSLHAKDDTGIQTPISVTGTEHYSFLEHERNELSSYLASLARNLTGSDGSKISISIRPDYFPEVSAREQDTFVTIDIAVGVFVFVESEDELAFLILRAFRQIDERKKTQDRRSPETIERASEANILNSFIFQTNYNPTAAVSYFERLAGLLDDIKSVDGQVPYETIAGTKYSSEKTMIAKEFAKIAIEDAAWSKRDLSTRLDSFQPFLPGSGAVTDRKLLYFSYLHHFFGPDYQTHINDITSSRLFLLTGSATAAISSLVLAFKFGHKVNSLIASPLVNLEPTITTKIATTVLGVGEAAFGSKLVYNHFFVPSVQSQENIYKLQALHSKLDLLQNSEISKLDVENLFKQVADLPEDPYWIGAGTQKAYSRILDLAIASKLTFDVFDLLPFSNKRASMLVYPLLLKVGKLLDFNSLNKSKRLAAYTSFSEPDNLIGLTVAVLYLTTMKHEIDDHAQEMRKAIHVLNSAPPSFPYWDLKIDLAANHCMMFFQQDADHELQSLLQAMKNEEKSDYLTRTQECLVRNIAKNTQYKYVVRQRTLLKKFFHNSPSALRAADEYITEFVHSFTDITEFVLHVNTNFETSFDAYEIGSANGEAVLLKPELIRDLKGVHAILDSDYFWSKRTDYREINDQAQRAMTNFKKAAKGYNIELTESLHEVLLKKIRVLKSDLQPQEKKNLWTKFVRRGTSIYSDELFKMLSVELDDFERSTLLSNAIENGLLHDQEVKKKYVKSEVESFIQNSKSRDDQSPIARKRIIEEIARISVNSLGVGLAHRDIMEQLSQRIESSAEESQEIEQWKINRGSVSDEVKDEGLDLLIAIIKETRDWPKEKQWDFIQFLVGHRPYLSKESAGILLQFALTPSLLREKFVNLPHTYQYKLIDALLTRKGGLLEKVSPAEAWTQRLIDYFVAMVDPNAHAIVRELVDAYLVALDNPGLKYFKSTVFAHLLVSSQKGKKSSEVVALICQHFGAFGIKLGQFLLATGILPEAENEGLRALEDNAREPTREEIYGDLREILGTQFIPYNIKKVVGGASLKYVVLATKEDGSEVVLKILAKDASIHTPLEEKIMKRIATYLVETYGQKYSVFKSAVFAAAEAVRRELSFSDEVERSQLAFDRMYKTCGDENVSVQLVKETFIHERLIEAEFAPGNSIQAIAPTRRSQLAKTILACELANLFPESASPEDPVYFEPDRHFGNFRVTNERVTPIDFGQLHVMTVAQRDRTIDLFAVSGLLQKIGEHGATAIKLMGNPLSEKIGQILEIELTSSQLSILKQNLAVAFADRRDETGVSAYYRLLSVLETQGLLASLGEKRIPLYDLPKGLLQLSRLSSFLKEGDLVETLETKVKGLATERAKQIAEEIGLRAPGYMDFVWYYLGR